MKNDESRSWETTLILIACMALLGFMWFSLSSDVKSGKAFELDKKWYIAVQVQKPESQSLDAQHSP